MPAVILASPAAVFSDYNQQVVHNNSTVNTSSSTIFTGFGNKELNLIINVKGVPTGSAPTLQYSIQEVDPGDGLTAIGSPITGTIINSVSTQIISLPLSLTGAVKISWTVGGTGSPTFTGVYTSLICKSSNLTAGLNPSGNQQTINLDSSGNVIIVGKGTAGSQLGGVLTIQGDPSGTPIPITGSISATNPSVSTNNAAIPSSSTQIGGSDGTNLQALKAFDLDTGAGSDYNQGVSIRLPSSGGSVAGGTGTNPIRIDPTGSTIQPVSGTVTANAGTGNFTVVQPTAANLNATVTGTVTANIGTTNGLALDATLTGGTQTSRITDGTNTATVKAASTAAGATDKALVVAISPNNTVAATQSGTWTVQPGNTPNSTPWLSTISQGGNSATVSAGGALKVDGSAVTQPVSGTVTANIGSSGSLALDATVAKLTIAQSVSLGSNTQSMVGGSVTTASPTYVTGNINPLSLTTAGALRVDGSAVTQPISGTISGSGNFTVVQPTAANLNATVTGTVAASQSGTWTVQPGNTANTTPWLSTISQGGNSATVTASNALKVDGSAVTQPVSGTVTANIGSSGSLALDATLTGGTAKSIVRGGAKGSTVAADVTSTASGSNHQLIDIAIYDASGNQITSFGGGTQYADGTVRGTATGTLMMIDDGTNIQSVSGDSSGRLNINAVGSKTNNTAIPSTTNLGTLPAVATTSTPTYVDGYQVALSTDLTGALRITGSISASNPSVSTNNAAIPTSSTQIGGSDGTNLQAARIFDLDSGGGTQYVLGVGLRKTSSGGSVEAGTASDPLRIDPTGSTIQPVSGTVAATQSGTWTVQPGNTANTTPWLATISQGGNSATVSAGGALKVDGSAVTQPVSGTVTANIGSSGSLALDATVAKLTIAQSASLGSNTQAMVGGSVTTAAPTYVTGNINPLSLTTAGALRIDGSGSTQPVSGAVTANIGSSGSLALDATLTGGTQTSRITDGTNTATVKAASTAAIATDKALVVAISPNNTVAATQSGTWTVQPGNTPNSTPWLSTISQGGNSATVSAGGALKVDGSAATQPVSGTVTANIGSSGSLALDATVAKLTIAQSTSLGSNTQAMVGGSVTTAAPTYVTGNINPLSLTTSGALRIDGSGSTQPVSGTVTANIGSSGSLALDATLTGGTQRNKITDGTNNAAVKAASTAAIATDPALVVAISPNNTVTVTGTVTAANASVSTTGSAPPASATYMAGSVTTSAPTYTTGQMSGLSLTTAGAIRVDGSGSTQPVSGTVAATQSGTWTVQPGNTANTTPWLSTISQGGNAATVTVSNALKVDGSAVTQPVSGTITANIGSSGSLALDATVAKLTIAQSAALGSNTQAMVGGSVTTAAPTYVTGNINPLSLTTAGALRVDSSGSTQPVSGTVTANIGSSGSLALDATLTGGTAKSIVRGGAKGSTVAADVTSTASGSNHQLIDIAIYDASGNQITSFGGGTQYADGAVRGTATGTLMMVDDGTNIQSASGDSSGKLNVNAIQGTAASLSGYWPVRVTDGTNGMPTMDTAGRAGFNKITDGTNTAAVKAASTAAIATDPALVVAISPNNPLIIAPTTDTAPATQNITARDVVSASTTVANNGSFVTGSPTAGSTALFSLTTIESIRVQVTGTWTGTLALESSIDGGTTWYSSGCHQSGTAYTTNNFTANFIGVLNTAGATNFRVRATAAWTGTATVKVIESVNNASVYITNPLKLADATTQSVQATIKDASTAAIATDTALVVAISPNNSLSLAPASSATSSVTSVSGSATNVTLLSSNASRKIAMFFNDSSAVLYLKFGATATTSSYTVQLSPSAYYEMPSPIYTGQIDGIWSSANGNVRVTELT